MEKQILNRKLYPVYKMTLMVRYTVILCPQKKNTKQKPTKVTSCHIYYNIHPDVKYKNK